MWKLILPQYRIEKKQPRRRRLIQNSANQKFNYISNRLLYIYTQGVPDDDIEEERDIKINCDRMTFQYNVGT